jgi:hypothetical protein
MRGSDALQGVVSPGDHPAPGGAEVLDPEGGAHRPPVEDHAGAPPRPRHAGQSAWWRWRGALVVGCTLTVALRVATELAGLVTAYGGRFPSVVLHRPGVLVSVWNRFDVLHYVGIARAGYPPLGHHGQLSSQLAFAPLYPWCVRAVHLVVPSWGASALLVSFVATAAGLTGLYRLVELDFGRSAAGTTVLLLVCWPTAFFLVAGYPQSLGLCLVVWAFLAVRHRRLWWAGLAVAGAALCEYYLALTALALLVEAWPRPWGAWSWPVRLRRLWRPVGALFAPAAAALGGVGAYGALRYHDALAVVHVQALWERHLAPFWQSYARNIHDVVTLQMLTFVGTPMELADLLTTVLLGLAALYCFFRVRRSYGVLLAVAWCVFSFQTVLVSETREVLVLFPFFVVPAVWLSRHRLVRLVVLVALLVASWALVGRFVTDLFAG